MKKNIVFLFILVIAGSCGKDFLDRKPISDLTSDNFYQSPSDAKEAILAVYSVIQGQQFYGTAYMEFAEYAGDDATTKNNNNPLDDFNWSSAKDLGGEGTFNGLWIKIYEGIYRSNLVLEKIPKIEMNANDKKIIIAEAYMFRGIYYWYLATLFGNAPIFTKPATLVEEIYGKQENQARLYKQSIDDMEIAVNDLPDSWDNANTGRLTKTAGQAFLGKAYLYAGCYDKANAATHFKGAASNLRKVVTSNRHKLLANFDQVFNLSNENNAESVFEIQYKDRGPLFLGWYSDGGNANEGTRRDQLFGIQNQVTQNGFGEIIATQNWANSLEIGDPRIRQTLIFMWDSSLTGYEDGTFNKSPKKIIYQPSWSTQIKAAGNISGEYYHVKKAVNGFVGTGGALNSNNNWRLIRYSDVLLMLSEAILESEGVTAEAIGYLNQVRARAKASSGYNFLITNEVKKTNPSFVGTIDGAAFLNPFPYFTGNLDGSNPFDPNEVDIDLTDGSYLSFRKAIVLERRAELAFEYHRFLDIVRWEALDDNHPGAAFRVFKNKPNPSDKKLYIKGKHNLLPIPQTQIDLSKGNLVQNPGY